LGEPDPDSRRARGGTARRPVRHEPLGGGGQSPAAIGQRRSFTMDESRALIRLSKVSKYFVTEQIETRALAGIDLDIEAGDFVSVSGPSGCGKTTLLSILGLLDTPSDGNFVLGGQAMNGLSATQRAKLRRTNIGFIFQSFNLIGDLSVRENVELPLTYQ